MGIIRSLIHKIGGTMDVENLKKQDYPLGGRLLSLAALLMRAFVI
ncbi:MAG: hypothetical protein BWY74_04006 [Firmicutes bacterium ADurb.Bin419]|nr:MAG: hypothetical protein BWY74_04006 [Firmicutes bacterium ADurb.Bin419]